MNTKDSSEPILKPEASRYMFAMFDVLGFSRWLDTVGLQVVLDVCHLLIERVVLPNEKGGLSTIQTREGSIFAVTGPPGYAVESHFPDTIILWHPLVPPFVDDFVTRCSTLICEALAMDIPLRGAITLGDAVLDRKSDFFLGTPIVEAAQVEKAQNWLGLTFGQSSIWSQFLAQIHGTAIIEYPPPAKEHLNKYVSPEEFRGQYLYFPRISQTWYDFAFEIRGQDKGDRAEWCFLSQRRSQHLSIR